MKATGPQQGSDEKEEDRSFSLQKILSFSESILKKRDDAVVGRANSGVELRWREDEQAFDGYDPVLTGGASMIDYAIGEASRIKNTANTGSMVVVNVIGPKVETAVGRFCDIMLPVDDRNWALKTTPVPDLIDGLSDTRDAGDAMQTGAPIAGPDGQPMRIADIARSQIDEAKKKMSAMETEIADQLTECQWNAQCREAIDDAARIGTGILKGPSVVKSLQKRWKRQADETASVYVLDMAEAMSPSSTRVNPWNVFPDPNCGGNPKKMTYIWEYDEISPRELRNLIGVDGYLEEQIILALNTDPKRNRVVYTDKGQRYDKYAVDKGSTFERWEYHGDVNVEDLESLGCSCDDFAPGQTVSACVVFVNDIPIKAALNTLDTGDLPYDFFQWRKVAGSIWGIGIPRMMMWQQRIIIGAWRAMMDNAADSSGVNIVVNRMVIEPADGKWELAGRKLWLMVDRDADVRTAFSQFQVASIQQSLERIIDLAIKFTDMETAIPMMFQGEKTGMPETLGATNVMVDSNNVALRSRVKRWDDQITCPHLTRYYHHNMQYSEKDEIKGDYSVDARGVSALLLRDQQANELVQIMGLRQDPMANIMIDWKKAYKELFAAKRLDVLNSDDVIATKEEEMKNAPPQQNPALEVAKVRVQGDMEKAKIVNTSDMEELRFKASDAEAQRQFDREMKQMDLQIKQMEFAQKRNISLDQIKADLAAASEKLNVQVGLARDKSAVGPEIITPPVEPAGRASDGRSFPE